MVDIICLQDSIISSEEYDIFLRKIYDEKAYKRHIKRNSWYAQGKGYRVYLALLDGRIVGQTCNFRADAVIHGIEVEWWWSVDTYVLPEVRGYGVGKLLQIKQREDKPNVGAAWYSVANGYILSKVGGKTISTWQKNYYPISRFYTLLIEKVVRNYFHKDICIPLSIPRFYSFINQKSLREYDVREEQLSVDICNFINDCLFSQYDFFIKRDYDYLKWKLFDNPDVINATILSVRKDDIIEAIFIFSDADGSFTKCFKGVRVIGYFVNKKSVLKEKDSVQIISRYLHQNGIKKDGVLMLSKGEYLPKIVWPKKGNPFYSTYSDKIIECPYIDFSDEDMEQ